MSNNSASQPGNTPRKRGLTVGLFRSRLVVRLAIMFILVALLPMAIVIFLSYQRMNISLTELALSKVAQETELLAKDTETYLSQFYGEILFLSDISQVQGLIRAQDYDGVDPATKETTESWTKGLQEIFSSMTWGKRFYRSIAYINEFGDEVVRVDYRYGVSIVAFPLEHSYQQEFALQEKIDEIYFTEARELELGTTYVSPLHLERDESGEIRSPHTPIINLSTPLYNKSGEFRGIVMTAVDANNFLDRLHTDLGQVYLADQDGFYLAHPDQDKTFGFELGSTYNAKNDFPDAFQVLKKTGDTNYVGLDAPRDEVLAIRKINYDPRHPGHHWILIRTLPQDVVLGDIQRLGSLLAGLVLFVAVIAILLAFWLAGNFTTPILHLTEVVKQIGDGNLEVRAYVESRDEVGLLARAFNDMTSKLRYALKLAIERSRRLETVATLGGSLNVILDFDQLLDELVVRVKEQFDYYHAQIFIVDEDRQSLVLRTGYGEPGRRMKDNHYMIPLDASTSLVAQAASEGKVVAIDDVYEIQDWWSNPLLPDTRCELAVPIIIEGNVLGVLDVQSDSIAGLDEGDADLLRSLANHTAIALVNARLFEQAVRAREEAEEANRLKSRFLATMSHELRTPLSSVINFAQIIKREKLGPVTVKQRDFLERIQTSSKHVLGLINDVLDMAKIEAGRMELFREPVDLHAVLREVISTAKVLIGDKDIELQSDIRPDLPLLDADKTRLRQILLNILSNAIKFTKRGNITVRAWMNEKEVIISISDTGIGIKEQDFPSVFAEFQQVEGDTSRQYEGTGLGMSIAKRLVEMHGGRIWFESEWGKGSTFTCALPQSNDIHSSPNISNKSHQECDPEIENPPNNQASKEVESSRTTATIETKASFKETSTVTPPPRQRGGAAGSG